MEDSGQGTGRVRGLNVKVLDMGQGAKGFGGRVLASPHPSR